MKNLLIFICFVNFFGFAQEIEMEKMYGNWKYQYSYNDDTCINLLKYNNFDGNNKLTKKYTFPNLVSTKDTSFNTKLFLSKKWTNVFCNISSIQTLKNERSLNIIYYSDESRTFKLHWFFLDKLDNSQMILFEEHYYNYSKTENGLFYHVYKRVK